MVRIFIKALRRMQKEEPELVGNAADQRNWRGIIIALIVIVAVLGLIVTAIVLVTPRTTDEVPGKKLNFKDFMHGVYEPRLFHPVWGQGETFIYRSDEGALVEFNCADNNTSPIMDNSSFRQLDTSQYKVSPDKKYVLLPTDIQYIYRHSQISKFKIYDIDSKTKFDLVGAKGPYFQFVTWSDRHNLIYVQENNIYYLKDIKTEDSLEITTDGEIDQIYNGIPDWLYEEEILHSDNSIWQSPDSRFIVYASISDNDVYRYDMTVYGNSKYVENKRLAYPKPGTPNPTVELKVFDLRTNLTIDILPPADFRKVEHYLTGVTFKDSSRFLVTWLNRPQNVSILAICDAISGECIDNYRAEADGGWIDIQGPQLFTPNGNNYFIILPQKDGSAGSFKHIAIIDSTTDSSATHNRKDATKLFVTAGRMDVQRIVGYNFEQDEVYFTAIKQSDPTQRHLYSATILKDDANFRQTTCLSCGISDDCLFVDARFSKNAKYYVLECKGPGVPVYSVRSVPNKLVRVLEDNKQLKQYLATRALPKVEFLKLPIENDQHILVKVLLPQVLKKEEILTYNLLVKVYGAPNTQHVTHEFDVGWETYLSSEHDLIIGFVDGRGSSGRGDDWLHSNYKGLGTKEVEDLLKAAKYLKDLPYVNEQTAIWGLSHGGFLTLAALANRKNVFSCGMSVAPVTDWRYYDSFYTERYMGQPTAEDNLDAYNNANISRYASNFRKTKLMLIHGTGDDNVHFQNSAQLIKALTEKDVYFRTQIYTDQQHMLNGGNTRTHLYNTMENFLNQCYGKTSTRETVSEEVSEKDDEVEEE